MKKLISLLLTGLMCANLTAPALAAEDTADTAAPGKTAVTFTDMPSSPEFIESITWAVENGITTGMYDGQFWPDYTCNISQILTFIWRMSGRPVKTPSVMYRTANGTPPPQSGRTKRASSPATRCTRTRPARAP